MRAYPVNSPSAAARIVALTMLADGNASPDELHALESTPLIKQLGVNREELATVVQALCEDLLHATDTAWGQQAIATSTLTALMAELSDPALRRLVLQACLEVAGADAHLADGECQVLSAALQCWSADARRICHA
jgi:uncharacterized tellurite resistance protein B-like protein